MQVILSTQMVENFQKIMKQEYGQELTFAEAEEQEIRLVKFFELLIKIDQKQKTTQQADPLFKKDRNRKEMQEGTR